MSNEPHLTTTPRQTTAREFLAILFRRKALVLGLFAVTTLTVLVLSFSTRTQFLSTARVLVKRGEKESALQAGRRLYNDWEEEMGSEVEVVKSAPVLERARQLLATESGPSRTPIPLNGGSVDAEVRGRTNVILIGYTDADPVTARVACDAVSRAYVEYRQNDFSLTLPRSFFEGEIEKVQKDLDYWTDRRRSYAEHANVVDLDDQRTHDLERLNILQLRQSDLKTMLAQAQTVTEKLGELEARGVMDPPGYSQRGANDETGLIELKRRVIDTEFRVASLREKMRDDAPEMLAAVATLDTLRAMLHREIVSRVETARGQEDVVRAQLTVVEQEIAQLESGLASIPDKEESLSEMDHRIAALRARYQELTEKREQLNITENTSSSRSVVLLARAAAAQAQNQRDYVRLALAPVFSLVVGVGLAFFLDGLDLTVRTARQAEEAIDVPVLASLTERTRRRRRRGDLSPEAAA